MDKVVLTPSIRLGKKNEDANRAYTALLYRIVNDTGVQHIIGLDGKTSDFPHINQTKKKLQKDLETLGLQYITPLFVTHDTAEVLFTQLSKNGKGEQTRVLESMKGGGYGFNRNRLNLVLAYLRKKYDIKQVVRLDDDAAPINQGMISGSEPQKVLTARYINKGESNLNDLMPFEKSKVLSGSLYDAFTKPLGKYVSQLQQEGYYQAQNIQSSHYDSITNQAIGGLYDLEEITPNQQGYNFHEKNPTALFSSSVKLVAPDFDPSTIIDILCDAPDEIVKSYLETGELPQQWIVETLLSAPGLLLDIYNSLDCCNLGVSIQDTIPPFLQVSNLRCEDYALRAILQKMDKYIGVFVSFLQSHYRFPINREGLGKAMVRDEAANWLKTMVANNSSINNNSTGLSLGSKTSLEDIVKQKNQGGSSILDKTVNSIEGYYEKVKNHMQTASTQTVKEYFSKIMEEIAEAACIDQHGKVNKNNFYIKRSSEVETNYKRSQQVFDIFPELVDQAGSLSGNIKTSLFL